MSVGSHSPTVIKNIDHSNHVDSVAGIPACVWPCQHPVNTLSPLRRPRASSWSSSGHYSIPRSIVDNHLNSDTIFHHSSDLTTQIFRIWCCRVGGSAWLKVINCMHFVSDRFKIFILYHVHVCFCIKDGWFWFCLVQKIFVYCLIETSPSIQSRLVTTASFFPRWRHPA